MPYVSIMKTARASHQLHTQFQRGSCESRPIIFRTEAFFINYFFL